MGCDIHVPSLPRLDIDHAMQILGEILVFINVIFEVISVIFEVNSVIFEVILVIFEVISVIFEQDDLEND